MATTKTSYSADKNILIAPELALTYSCMISNTGITSDSNGRKIVKAGTPLAGDITARETAFTATKTGAIGIILHDTDVTDTFGNGTIVMIGSVDLLKLDSTVVSMLDSATKALMPNIIFIKGAK